MTARTLTKPVKVLVAAVAALLCAACASAPERVRKQASSALACDAAALTVNRTERRYLGDQYEVVGCGQKVNYECERAYVVFIPVGTLECRKQ